MCVHFSCAFKWFQIIWNDSVDLRTVWVEWIKDQACKWLWIDTLKWFCKCVCVHLKEHARYSWARLTFYYIRSKFLQVIAARLNRSTERKPFLFHALETDITNQTIDAFIFFSFLFFIIPKKIEMAKQWNPFQILMLKGPITPRMHPK